MDFVGSRWTENYIPNKEECKDLWKTVHLAGYRRYYLSVDESIVKGFNKVSWDKNYGDIQERGTDNFEEILMYVNAIFDDINRCYPEWLSGHPDYEKMQNCRITICDHVGHDGYTFTLGEMTRFYMLTKVFGLKPYFYNNKDFEEVEKKVNPDFMSVDVTAFTSK